MNHHNSSVTGNSYNQITSFQQDKLSWENAINTYNGSDPLELWFNYICWYEQNISLDTANSFESILGKCLSMYEYRDNFKQDIRMVKLWMKYIDLKPNPLNLYQVLYQRGLGTQCSVFYIGWAHYFESAGAFKQAESVYNLGFQAKAHPYEDLEGAHTKFRLAVAQRMLYDDSQSKKRTASQLAEQRQVITTLKTQPVHKKMKIEDEPQPPLQQLSSQHIQTHQHMLPIQQQPQIPAVNHQSTHQISTPQLNHHQTHLHQHQHPQQQHPQQQQQQQQQQHQQPQHIQTVKEATYDDSSSSQSEHCDLNNSANVISSSLNSVYGDTQSNSYNYDEQYEPLGINLPSNFARFSSNNFETWTGALCLDEPNDPNKQCNYPKHLVYTGNGTEYSLEEIRSRKYANRIEYIKERNRKWEYDRMRAKEEKLRQELEQKRKEQERFRIEQERIRIETEQQERIRHEQQQRLQQEQERLQAAEYERIRLEQERQRASEFQRLRSIEMEQELAKAEQAEHNRLENERLLQKQSVNHANNNYNRSSSSYITNTITSSKSVAATTTVIHNPCSDDIEEQIEASTIRFSTDNGRTKPKTLTIKFRKEKPSTLAADTSTVPLNQPQPPPPETAVTPIKSRKDKKSKATKRNSTVVGSNGSAALTYQEQFENNHQSATKGSNNNMHDDANLLLSLANMHSSSNDDDTSYSYSSGHPHQESSFIQNEEDDSFSNSEFTRTYPFSADNSNGDYQYSATSTPVRNNTGVYSKTSTPRNFQILKKRTSNLSYQNDDSMCSVSAADQQQNSFFMAENNDDLKQRRIEQALSTIETHLAKPALDPFNSELCKAFLTKIGFPSREQSDTCKLVSTPISKLTNAKVALLANIPFQIEKEVGRGSYGSVFRAINVNTGNTVALKFQKPANHWELYICTEVRKKVTNPNVLMGIMDISTAIVASNASIFVTEFSQYGSLLDINNRIRQSTTKVMHESLVMHFSSQILNIVDHLHSCKIIHADIKPDNFLLMKIPNPNSHVPTIRLIDFGCAIDMNFFEPKVQFRKIIQTDGFTCIEMQEGRPWSYQTDIFCIAGTIHVMLFGEYMQPVKKFGQWDIKLKIPRYLKKHIWSEMFTKYLNIKDIDHLPNLMETKRNIDRELYNMESELHSQIRTLSNILHRR